MMASRTHALAAWDVQRNDWRTFRVDRVQPQPRMVQSARFEPRQPPEDFATLVARSITASPYRFQARLRVRGTAADLRVRIPSWIGLIEPLDEEHSILTVGGDSHETVAAAIALVWSSRSSDQWSLRSQSVTSAHDSLEALER